MKIVWTSKAQSDVIRLHDFLKALNPRAAEAVARNLVTAPTRLAHNSRIGERLDEFAPREVRRILVGAYEMRYELTETHIHILRVWHSREDR